MFNITHCGWTRRYSGPTHLRVCLFVSVLVCEWVCECMRVCMRVRGSCVREHVSVQLSHGIHYTWNVDYRQEVSVAPDPSPTSLIGPSPLRSQQALLLYKETYKG